MIAGIIGDALSKGLGTGGKSPTVSQVFNIKICFTSACMLWINNCPSNNLYLVHCNYLNLPLSCRIIKADSYKWSLIDKNRKLDCRKIEKKKAFADRHASKLSVESI